MSEECAASDAVREQGWLAAASELVTFHKGCGVSTVWVCDTLIVEM